MTLNPQSKEKMGLLLDQAIWAQDWKEFEYYFDQAKELHQQASPADGDFYHLNIIWEEKLLLSFFTANYYFSKSGNQEWRYRAEESLDEIINNDLIHLMAPSLEQTAMKNALLLLADDVKDIDGLRTSQLFIPDLWLDRWSDLSREIQVSFQTVDFNNLNSLKVALTRLRNYFIDNDDAANLAQENIVCQGGDIFRDQAINMLPAAQNFLNKARRQPDPAVQELVKPYLDEFHQAAESNHVLHVFDSIWRHYQAPVQDDVSQDEDTDTVNDIYNSASAFSSQVDDYLDSLGQVLGDPTANDSDEDAAPASSTDDPLGSAYSDDLGQAVADALQTDSQDLDDDFQDQDTASDVTENSETPNDEDEDYEPDDFDDLPYALYSDLNSESTDSPDQADDDYDYLVPDSDEPAPVASESEPTQPDQPVESQTPTAQASLPDDAGALRKLYYQTAQDVLGEYNDRVKKLNDQLYDCLSQSANGEFLQFTKHQVSAKRYIQQFNRRSQAVDSYLDQHPDLEQAVMKAAPDKDDLDHPRSVNYWTSFPPHYKEQTASLFFWDKSLKSQSNYSFKEDRKLAYRVADHRTQLLQPRNRQMLQEIYEGLYGEDKKAQLDQDIEKFRHDSKVTLQGQRGEDAVTKLFKREEVISSVNLPYAYGRKKANSNQIDSIIVNRHGIFILEVKTYSGQAIGISDKGLITVKKRGRTYHYGDIIKQGHDHQSAAKENLQKDLSPKEWNYLKNKLHMPIQVLYVTAQKGVDTLPAPAGRPDHRFMTPGQVKHYINNQPYILADFAIQNIRNAFANHQLTEKQYVRLNFPEDMTMTVQDSGQELQLIEDLLATRLDDLIKKRQPGLLKALRAHKLVPKNGIVTHRQHWK